MKRICLVAMLLLFIGLLSACNFSFGGWNRLNTPDAIKSFLSQNVDEIKEIIDTGDYEKLKALKGVESVFVDDDYIEFFCGGNVIGPGTHYYGFFYDINGDLKDSASPGEGWMADGKGFRWTEPDGDNEFYIEKIIEGFFYYEGHF